LLRKIDPKRVVFQPALSYLIEKKRLNILHIIEMKKTAVTAFDSARICHISGDTAKREVEQGIMKGYRMGTGQQWRILLGDLALFLKDKHIPVPDSKEIGTDFRALLETETSTTVCWEFYGDNERSRATQRDV
jgi:hypothetical protein